MANGAAGGASNAGTISNSANGSIKEISSWISKVNPHYGNPFFPQSSVNCGSCALAVENRLSGNKGATASLTNIGTDAGMEQATGKKCTYMGLDEMTEFVKSQGSGAHFIVGINRRLPNGKSISGHWFNVYNDGGKLYTLEGQAGEIFEWPHDYGYISEWCIMI